jgi:putative spermidine/putrescine transport system ATP-binding protein/mannopine transport system ATP-binding protein
MTVLENIAFPLKMRGVDRAEHEEGARAALDTVGLGGLENRRPAQLAKGQRQLRRAAARRLLPSAPKHVSLLRAS